jgi:hypothetical protein
MKFEDGYNFNSSFTVATVTPGWRTQVSNHSGGFDTIDVMTPCMV